MAAPELNVVKSWVVCQACRCHARGSERDCPQCGLPLVPADTSRLARREVRRQWMAVAMAGVGVACGGNNAKLPSTTDPLVVGSCSLDGGVQTIDCTGSTACVCGYMGHCDGTGTCVSCGCDAGQTCLTDGTCSSHTCYGAPALLA